MLHKDFVLVFGATFVGCGESETHARCVLLYLFVDTVEPVLIFRVPLAWAKTGLLP